MRVLFLLALLCAVQVESQFWKYPQHFLQSWLRQGKTGSNIAGSTITTLPPITTTVATTKAPVTTTVKNLLPRSTNPVMTTNGPVFNKTGKEEFGKRMTKIKTSTNSGKATTKMTTIWSTVPITTQSTTTNSGKSTTTGTTTNTRTTFTQTTYAKPTTVINNLKRTTLNYLNTGSTTNGATEASTIYETTTHDVTATTEEPRDNHRTHDFYLSKREKPQVKIASNISQNLLPLPAGASAALVKPTKYHYYPHNQHIYLLPECAIQQVCNAVYIRLNWTQPLCACPSRYRDPCSASLNSDDQHTTELMIDRKAKAKNRAITLVKTCEPTSEMRICRSPRDWSLLALQNIRTGKSHYLVICRCPDSSTLEGPMSHDQPTYASVPGIRVYGMMCVDNKRRGRPLRTSRSLGNPPFPWVKAVELAKTAIWD